MKFGKLSCPDAADYLYFWLTAELDAKELRKFELQLWLPPAGEEATEDNPLFSDEAEMAAFDNLNLTMAGSKPAGKI